MNNIFFHVPPGVISEYKQQKINKKKKFQYSNDEILKDGFFNSTNQLKGKDGRTYQYIDNNGEYVSCRVSPYSPYIFDNLEPQIKDLILTLLDKDYLTSDSCQGHKDRKYSYFCVVFNTKNNLNKFRSCIESFNMKISFQIINLKNSNQTTYGLIYDQNKFLNKKLTVQEYKNLNYSYQDAIDYFNLMFLRDYKEVYMLAVIVCDGRKGASLIQKIIYHFFKENYIKKLTNKIKHNMLNYNEN